MAKEIGPKERRLRELREQLAATREPTVKVAAGKKKRKAAK